MSSHAFARAKEIFLAACERPAAERADFARRECRGNEELLAEVTALLEFHAAEEGEESRIEPLGAGASDATSSGDPVGTTFAGRYRIVAEVGRGGMGTVYRAHDLVLDVPVAIKLLPEVDEARLWSLLNEVRTARRVTHANVCRVYDFGEWRGEFFLTMELVLGEDLASLLARSGSLPRERVVDVLHQVCSGLAAAHQEGILHRDLKPANILIDDQGQAKITDFGVAARVGSSHRPAGTPAYMAPEQRIQGAATERSDIYAVGLLLHEMATGEPLFELESGSLEVRTRSLPAALAARLGPDLHALVMRCVAPDPEDRPASMAEVAAALPSEERLRALVEAGRTPSPDDVAAAGTQRAQAARPHLAWLASLFVLALALPWLADLALPARSAWGAHDPAVLVARARQLLATSVGNASPRSAAWGFDPAAEYYADGIFWYRQSPSLLVPESVDMLPASGVATVGYDDPPQVEPGMARLELDSKARLVSLEVRLEEAPAAEAGDLLGFGFLRSAGYDPDALVATAPRQEPPLFVDRRHAWRYEEAGAVRQVEAGFRHGSPVFFLNQPAQEENEESDVLEERVWVVSGALWNLAWLVLAAGAFSWARRNRALGRGDVAGANRLAATLLIAGSTVWLLGSHHVPDLEAESIRLLAALGLTLVMASVAWLVYLALEPFVRRTWPQSLISWSQLLRGRITSPLVGRDLLVGIVFGLVWASLQHLDQLLVQLLGLQPLVEIYATWQLNTALDIRAALANLGTSFVDAMKQGLLSLFYLAALQRFVRRRVIAVPLFVLVVGTLEVADGGHPAVSWLTLGLGVGALTAFILLRFGVLTLIVAQTTFYFLQTSPVTLELDSWYAESGTVALLLVLLLGLVGFGLARR